MEIGHPFGMDAKSPSLPPESLPKRVSRAGSRIETMARPSLPEVNRTIAVPSGGHWLRRLMAFAGPGYLVSVGYMDPGNWATDLAGGSRFGYTLLSVILLSNLMAILLQALAASLASSPTATSRRLAAPPIRRRSIAALAGLRIGDHRLRPGEVIGSAIALKLLFGIPLVGGSLLTALDALLLLFLMNKGFRYLEAFVIALLVVIAVCFAIQIVVSRHRWSRSMLAGFVPSSEIITNPEMLYIAIGIIGATVMPHNLYLHSSIVQTRAPTNAERPTRCDQMGDRRFDHRADAGLVHQRCDPDRRGRDLPQERSPDVAEIGDAYELLSPLLGLGIASTLFAVALLASGLNSTVTATLAGQIVMDGFLDLRLPNWARRLLTRGIAIVPVVIVTALYGERGTADLLVFSQVVLSMQLPFAVIPLVRFVSDKRKMGNFAISRSVAAAAWIVAAVIVVLNVKLLLDMLFGG